jgi:hypothetical protein
MFFKALMQVQSPHVRLCVEHRRGILDLPLGADLAAGLNAWLPLHAGGSSNSTSSSSSGSSTSVDDDGSKVTQAAEAACKWRQGHEQGLSAVAQGVIHWVGGSVVVAA